jgi:hypothetical protein
MGIALVLKLLNTAEEERCCQIEESLLNFSILMSLPETVALGVEESWRADPQNRTESLSLTLACQFNSILTMPHWQRQPAPRSEDQISGGPCLPRADLGLRCADFGNADIHRLCRVDDYGELDHSSCHVLHSPRATWRTRIVSNTPVPRPRGIHCCRGTSLSFGTSSVPVDSAPPLAEVGEKAGPTFCRSGSRAD